MMTHPVALRMLEQSGVDVSAYVSTVRGMLTYSHARDSGMFDGADMVAHRSGVQKAGLLMTIDLSDKVHFVTGPGEDAARVTLTDVDMPETLRQAYIGRPVNTLVSHTLLDMPGLDVVDIRDIVDSAKGTTSVYVTLAPMPWVHIPGTSKPSMMSRVRRRFKRRPRG
jgi:hypothetical protein